MEFKEELKTERKGHRKITGWIITLIIIVVLFAIGAIFCAPWSPIHKKLEKAQNNKEVNQVP